MIFNFMDFSGFLFFSSWYLSDVFPTMFHFDVVMEYMADTSDREDFILF